MTHGMTAVREDPLARLDAWVLEELEALTGPRNRPPERARQRREPEPMLEPGPQDAPLALDETHFVQQVTGWLSGRPNADLILEEIWRNVVAADIQEDAENEPEPAVAAESLGDEGDLDLDTEAPVGPVEPFAEPPADHPPQA
jgi:hypothetical protein